MKQKVIAILAVTICGIILTWGGFTLFTAPKQNTQTLQPLDNAQDIYLNAVAQIDSRKDLSLRISLTKEMTVGRSTFMQTSEFIVEFDESGLISVQETLTSGTHRIHTTEILSDDTLYLTVDDAKFISICEPSQYRNTLIPAVILTADHYGTIAGHDNGSNYTINFSSPTYIEPWVTNSVATLSDATGSAIIDYEGNLASSMYTVAYVENGINFRTTTHVVIEPNDVEISLPEDTTSYVQISDWQAPKLLEYACGYLIQADCISSQYQDRIYFQAIGDLREQRIELHAYNDDQWLFCMATDVQTKNNTKQDQQTDYRKQELFIDGQYSVSTGTAPISHNPNITIDTVYNYFQNQLVSTIILPKDISTASISEIENTIRIEYTGTDTFAEHLIQNACEILYQNADLLANTGADLQADDLVCYLEINKHTGLPISSGILFQRSYATEGIPYQIEYSAEQIYNLPSNTALSEITKAAGL